MRRRVAIVLLLGAAALLAGLILAPTALAGAGGGTSGYGGGGGGGGGRGFELFLLFRALFYVGLLGHGLGFAVLIGLAVLWWLVSRGMPKAAEFRRARAQRGSAAKSGTRRRERRVELYAAEAADVDPIFAPERVRAEAAELFRSVQFAWDADDRGALRALIAPSLYAEWDRRLADFERKGWRNRVELTEPPKVEYVGLLRRGDTDEHRVVVRIDARMRDYVIETATGRRIKRKGQLTETVRLREFWTLARRGDRWILASIEQGAEGQHSLDDEIVATAWGDEQTLHEQAVLETTETVPEEVKIGELVSLEYAGDARAAAADLSLVDGRFAPTVLEVAARRAAAAWSEAVDGPDDALRRIAEPGAIRELLHPGDPSERTRLVVRGPRVRQITIAGIDPHAEPPTLTIDVQIAGRRYIQDRDTAAVLSGNPAKETVFGERWTLALTGEEQQPWRIVGVAAPAAIK